MRGLATLWVRARAVIAHTIVLVGLLPSTSAAQSSLDLQLSQSINKSGLAREVAPPAASGRYQIGPNDIISITVYQEPDLSVVDAKVASDGTISIPLLGNLHIAGLSSQQLNQLVTEKLADGYLRQPNVTVKVERKQLYYIKGEVATPGGYVLVDGLTVEKAIALAGGYTERAAKRDVTIVREGEPANKLHDASVSTRIHAGDVITVEESFF